MRELDIGDDEIGTEFPSLVEREPPIGDRPRLMAMRGEEVAEQFDVQRIVLDDQDPCQTELPKQ